MDGVRAHGLLAALARHVAGRWASESNALGLTRGHPYRRRHGRRPNAASSMAQAKRLDEAHAPLCATNRWAASTTVLSRSGTAHTGARADSARASCCPSNRAVSIPPSIIEGEHSKGAADNAPRTAIGRLTTKSAMRSRVARSGGFHGGKVQDRVVGDSTAVGVTELRAQRSGVAHGRIAPGVQAATIQPWPKTFRPSSLTAVFAMRPNRLARRFSAPATRALASSAGSTGSRGSFSRNASLAAPRWSALQPVTLWSDGTI